MADFHNQRLGIPGNFLRDFLDLNTSVADLCTCKKKTQSDTKSMTTENLLKQGGLDKTKFNKKKILSSSQPITQINNSARKISTKTEANGI